jgi:hypothetical protein
MDGVIHYLNTDLDLTWASYLTAPASAFSDLTTMQSKLLNNPGTANFQKLLVLFRSL